MAAPAAIAAANVMRAKLCWLQRLTTVKTRGRGCCSESRERRDGKEAVLVQSAEQSASADAPFLEEEWDWD